MILKNWQYCRNMKQWISDMTHETAFIFHYNLNMHKPINGQQTRSSHSLSITEKNISLKGQYLAFIWTMYKAIIISLKIWSHWVHPSPVLHNLRVLKLKEYWALHLSFVLEIVNKSKSFSRIEPKRVHQLVKYILFRAWVNCNIDPIFVSFLSQFKVSKLLHHDIRILLSPNVPWQLSLHEI